MNRFVLLSILILSFSNNNPIANEIVGDMAKPLPKMVGGMGKQLPKNACNSDKNCCVTCGYACDTTKPIKVKGVKYKGTCKRPWEK